MALIECKECGKQISKSAASCPNCGHKQKKRSGFARLLGMSILGTFALVAVIVAVNPEAGSSSATVKTPEQIAAEEKSKLDSSRGSYARIIVEREITKQLKAPSGAKFSGYSETTVANLRGGGPNDWIVRGHVDSQNSFGAMLRNNYQVILQFEEGKDNSYRIKSVDIYE